jgi:photosynthetic reaction center cytochrome c subunit
MNQRRPKQVLRATRAIVLFGLLFAAAHSLGSQGGTQSPRQPPQPMQPAEQVYKNIQVLNGIHAADLQGAMSFIASSLGVDCDYCHRQDKEGTFAGDTVPAKLRAREMIRMVRRINQETFHGKIMVNCFTCHEGRATPVSISLITPLPPRPSAATPAADTTDPSLPSVEQVLDHYVQALGGQAALDSVKSRIVKTVGLTAKNSESINEVFQKGPGKVLLVQQSPGYILWVGFNGQQAWAQDSEKSYWGVLSTLQKNSIIRELEFYQGSRLKSEYDKVAVARREKVGEVDTYVVTGISPEGTREKFFFDALTGLLLRRYVEEPTILGWFPIQADFEDYREVEGVKLPFVVRWSSAGGAWGIRTSFRVLEVRQNVPIEDAKFEHPSSMQ